MEVGTHLGVPTRRAASAVVASGASHCRTSSLRRIHDRVHAVHVDDVFKIGHSCNISYTCSSTRTCTGLVQVRGAKRYSTSRILLRRGSSTRSCMIPTTNWISKLIYSSKFKISSACCGLLLWSIVSASTGECTGMHVNMPQL